MNTSFDPFRLVNTYGAFGSITKQRNELIIQVYYNFNKTNLENRNKKTVLGRQVL